MNGIITVVIIVHSVMNVKLNMIIGYGTTESIRKVNQYDLYIQYFLNRKERKVMATTNNLATQEIFGESVRIEVARSRQALDDFAFFLPKLKKDYDEILSELEACTRRGQASAIMARVRKKYM